MPTASKISFLVSLHLSSCCKLSIICKQIRFRLRKAALANLSCSSSTLFSGRSAALPRIILYSDERCSCTDFSKASISSCEFINAINISDPIQEQSQKSFTSSRESVGALNHHGEHSISHQIYFAISIASVCWAPFLRIIFSRQRPAFVLQTSQVSRAFIYSCDIAFFKDNRHRR